MPGARRTRSLACKKQKTRKHSHHRFAEITPAFPARWLYGLLRALPGVPGLLAPVALSIISTRLDASVGAPGPHGLTVRAPAARLAARARPSHPAPDVRDDRDGPSCERGTGEI